MLSLRDQRNHAPAARVLAACPQVTRVEPGDPLLVYVRDVRASVVPVIRRLEAAGIDLTAIDQARASLDDVFLQYTGDRPQAEAPVVGAVSSIFAAAHGRNRGGGTP